MGKEETKLNLAIVLIAMALCMAGVSYGDAMGTAFTYQGRLVDANSPAEGSYDFEFELFDQDAGGNQYGNTVTKDEVDVIDGYFTVLLDFVNDANVFDGDARWLEIGVRPGVSGGSFSTLSPRQEITPVPYALALPGLWTQQNATSTNIIGGYSGNSVMSGVVGATIGGGGEIGFPNKVTDNYGTLSGGTNNQVGDDDGTTNDARYATVGGGAYNVASGPGDTVSGGSNNMATGQSCTVSGGTSNHAWNSSATICGGSSNDAAYCSTIGGGFANTATSWYSVVGGGHANTVSGPTGSAIGGGSSNDAYGNHSTIGGGYNNDAIGGDYATIGGGRFNEAHEDFTTVGGGYDNDANGMSATIPGGYNNIASGDYSFAAGQRAKAGHDGAFVWADSTDADFASTGNDQFLIRASGGVGIGTTSPQNKLDVEGAVAVGSTYSGTDTAPSNGMIVEGNVGIGTSTPADTLHVGGNGTIALQSRATDPAPSGGSVWKLYIFDNGGLRQLRIVAPSGTVNVVAVLSP